VGPGNRPFNFPWQPPLNGPAGTGKLTLNLLVTLPWIKASEKTHCE
jgi:hypothetical protein